MRAWRVAGGDDDDDAGDDDDDDDGDDECGSQGKWDLDGST